jgi:hypothetical protein
MASIQRFKKQQANPDGKQGHEEREKLRKIQEEIDRSDKNKREIEKIVNKQKKELR